MQDYFYIYISGMVLTNTGITFSSHNLKQLKMLLGNFSVQHIPIKIIMQHLFFVSFLLHFASVKPGITGFFRQISKVKTVNFKRWIIQGIKLKYKHFLLPVFFHKIRCDIFADATFLLRDYLNTNKT